MTKEDIVAKVFPDYADSIVDVRLVTFRNGHSKGLAYVEMKSAAIAEKAVKDKDEFEIGDRKLSVAISDPSLAKAGRSTLMAGQSRPSTSSSLMMIPRTAKTAPSKVKMQLDDDFKKPLPPESSNGAAQQSSNNGDSAQPAAKKLSNDQFRSMFLN